MNAAYIVGTFDVAELAFLLFFGFFIALVFYLNKESRREGYPLEDEETGKIHPGSLFDTGKKSFQLPHGRGTYVPEDVARDDINVPGVQAFRSAGAPWVPTGNAWRRAQGAKLARAAADRITAKVRGKTTLAAALAAEGKPYELEPINLERRALLARQGANVPPPLVLMFSMAEGSVKVLEGPRNIGWYVVALDEIATDPVDKAPGLLEQTRAQLAPTLTEEYRRQAAAAMRKELGTTRNDAAIEAVRKQLAGEQ